MWKALFTVAPLFVAITSASQACAPIDEATLTKVRANAVAISHKSWELGTLTEALLEYSWPQLTVFNNGSIPPAKELFASNYPDDVVKIATDVVKKKPSNISSLMADGSAGDPASIGPAVLLANWIQGNTSDNGLWAAASSQLDFLLNQVPHTDDGAISHRTSEAQLWADSVYMVPPFIAYFGAIEQGDSQTRLLKSAYDQCRLYRQYLQDPTTKLWKHIELGSWQDKNLWATGNAWAAAGMFRVLQTLRNSNSSESFVSEQQDLLDWTEEIVKASWDNQTSAGALHNVINNATWFEDTASTALLASVTFRLAVLKGDKSTYIPNANAAYDFVHRNIDGDGWLRNTVDPMDFYKLATPENPSPEGQSFVLLLEAARRAFQEWAEPKAPPPSAGGASVDLKYHAGPKRRGASFRRR